MPKPIRPLPPLTAEDAILFWSHVDIRGPDECWPWKWNASKPWVANFYVRSVKWIYRASRVAYFLHCGSDPYPLEVCHTCDNPPCCNPAHLFKGTHQDNMDDRDNKGRGVIAYGELCVTHKLTEQQVVEIKQLYASGLYLQRQLAGMYGVVQPHISRIVRHAAWSYFGNPVICVNPSGPMKTSSD